MRKIGIILFEAKIIGIKCIALHLHFDLYLIDSNGDLPNLKQFILNLTKHARHHHLP